MKWSPRDLGSYARRQTGGIRKNWNVKNLNIRGERRLAARRVGMAGSLSGPGDSGRQSGHDKIDAIDPEPT
jgi:hypothetical protein